MRTWNMLPGETSSLEESCGFFLIIPLKRVLLFYPKSVPSSILNEDHTLSPYKHVGLSVYSLLVFQF